MAEDQKSSVGVVEPSLSDDMSATPTKNSHSRSSHIIVLEQQHEMFRKVAFWSAYFVIFIFYLLLIMYIFCGFAKAGSHEVYIVVIVFATIPTALAMALMRYGFRNPLEKDDDSPSPMTLIQSLGGEILDTIRTYLQGRH